MAHVLPQVLRGGLRILLLLKARTRSIRTCTSFATSIAGTEISRVNYRDFLPKALATGSYVTAFRSLLFGPGLTSIQIDLASQRQCVSAAKIVVALS